MGYSTTISFGIITRFSSAGKGLSSANCMRIALLAIRPMLTYGASTLTPKTSLKSMNTFWNSVLRWATGCFRATNKRALWAEANAPPLDLYCLFLKRKQAIRILQASPLNNPITGRASPSFPTITTERVYSHAALLKGRPNPPKKWNSNASKGVPHLPIELLCSLIRPLIEEEVPPQKMAIAAKQQLLASWQASYPPPDYYKYPLTLKRPLFTNLHKFVATRIHQMRANKSYLRAQKSWINEHLSPLCQKCGKEDETPQHAILNCAASAKHRHPLLNQVTSLEEVWHDNTLTWALSITITAAKINFPRKEVTSPLQTGSAESSSLSSVSTISMGAP